MIDGSYRRRMSSPAAPYDLHFYFDPICPFAWMTSKWVRMVAAQRDYSVDWRFIALRFVNAGVDYASQFPPEYEGMHRSGLRLLRVAARIRAEHGRGPTGDFYAAVGHRLWESERTFRDPATPDVVAPVLAELGLPADLVDAVDSEAYDADIEAETDTALALTGKDVGTPILHFQPPEGVAFFGPVISRLPSPDDAAVLWDHVIGLARFPSFAELKRSLRELPQLRALGVAEDAAGVEEDWHGGSRRLKK
jgi:2-hydroxychromene-2-carboxylate isomerase